MIQITIIRITCMWFIKQNMPFVHKHTHTHTHNNIYTYNNNYYHNHPYHCHCLIIIGVYMEWVREPGLQRTKVYDRGVWQHAQKVYIYICTRRMCIFTSMRYIEMYPKDVYIYQHEVYRTVPEGCVYLPAWGI